VVDSLPALQIDEPVSRERVSVSLIARYFAV
jgi:hypothetical protein